MSNLLASYIVPLSCRVMVEKSEKIHPTLYFGGRIWKEIVSLATIGYNSETVSIGALMDVRYRGKN